jgi:hypothetical protein
MFWSIGIFECRVSNARSKIDVSIYYLEKGGGICNALVKNHVMNFTILPSSVGKESI